MSEKGNGGGEMEKGISKTSLKPPNPWPVKHSVLIYLVSFNQNKKIKNKNDPHTCNTVVLS